MLVLRLRSALTRMGYNGNQAGVAVPPPVPSSASAYGSYTGNRFHNATHHDPSFDSHSSSNPQFGDGYYAPFGAPVIVAVADLQYYFIFL